MRCSTNAVSALQSRLERRAPQREQRAALLVVAAAGGLVVVVGELPVGVGRVDRGLEHLSTRLSRDGSVSRAWGEGGGGERGGGWGDRRVSELCVVRRWLPQTLIE